MKVCFNFPDGETLGIDLAVIPRVGENVFFNFSVRKSINPKDAVHPYWIVESLFHDINKDSHTVEVNLAKQPIEKGK